MYYLGFIPGRLIVFGAAYWLMGKISHAIRPRQPQPNQPNQN